MARAQETSRPEAATCGAAAAVSDGGGGAEQRRSAPDGGATLASSEAVTVPSEASAMSRLASAAARQFWAACPAASYSMSWWGPNAPGDAMAEAARASPRCVR